jgi:RNA polymerase sigma-70 factor (ECF subfamily)
MTRKSEPDLEALMLRLADGDRAAFEPLYAALWPIVRRLTERMLLGAPEAEDAAQEAMMKVFARASMFEPGRDARAWVLGVAAYECKTLRQKQRRRREQAQSGAEERALEPSPEAQAIARELEAAATEVLGALRPADLATLRAVMDGERPDLPAATFRKRLERAIARLRSAWSSRHGTE